jgi:hypothetical protein
VSGLTSEDGGTGSPSRRRGRQFQHQRVDNERKRPSACSGQPKTTMVIRLRLAPIAASRYALAGSSRRRRGGVGLCYARAGPAASKQQQQQQQQSTELSADDRTAHRGVDWRFLPADASAMERSTRRETRQVMATTTAAGGGDVPPIEGYGRATPGGATRAAVAAERRR